MTLNPVTIYKQIAALLKAKKEINKMNFSEIKTSEGRAHIIGQILLVYSAIHGFIPVALTAKISLVAFAIYTAGRALVKAGEALAPLTKTTKDDEVIAAAGKLLDVVAPK